jgi:ABC-2 type transport system ATP-binding protein
MAKKIKMSKDKADMTRVTDKARSSKKAPVLEARKLTKAFDKVVALDEATFEVQKGEIFGLLGSNGAGKTTTLKIFSGLMRQTSGQALVLGKPVKGNEIFAKSNIGYLPETPALYETMTGFELLDLIGTIRKIPQDDLEKRIGHMAKVLELEDAMDNQIGTYSKGMRQKIAFAAAVMHEPRIMLMDEPTAGLDPRFGKLFKRWIRDFGSEGRSVLMCTHLTLIAEEICDRVAIIDKGRILEIGIVKELLEKYEVENLENVFVKVVGGKDWAKLLPSLR